jgi:hypothetical protein
LLSRRFVRVFDANWGNGAKLVAVPTECRIDQVTSFIPYVPLFFVPLLVDLGETGTGTRSHIGHVKCWHNWHMK